MDDVPVAITFRVDDEVVREIEAVNPRVRVLDYPQLALAPGMELTAGQREQALAALRQAEVIFGPSQLPRELLDAATRLKWFQVITAGVDNMAKDGLLDRGFTVTKATGLAAGPIAEYVLGVMLMLAKGLHTAARQQAEHEWQFRFSAELRGKTCGVVGLGAIGGETARLARAFGMRVVACRRRARVGEDDEECDALYSYTELERLLAESDYVVLCVPLTEETDRMIGPAQLAAMKPTASLINIARGAVVDQEALIAALRDGTVASAALDVFDPEPLPAESPLWDMPNVIVTPHISGAVEGYGHKAAAIFIRNLRHYLAGEPLDHVADPVLAY